MSKSLKQKAYSSVVWTALDTFGRQAMNFVVSVVLARLLAPADFGLIAMLAIFIALADSFADSGLSAALIQKPEVTPRDENSMFFVNIVAAFLGYGVLWFAAPYVAAFYGYPALTLLLRVLSLGIVIRSFGIVQTTLLKKRLAFRSLFLRSVLAIPVSGAVGIVMAYRGFGVWSLVAHRLVSDVISVACYWFINAWRPRWMFSLESFKALTGFGSRQLAVGLLDTFFQNLYQVVMGKLFSPAALGFYSRAVNLQKLATQNLTGIVYRVAFPLFCAVQDDVDRLRRASSRALTTLAMVILPVMVGLIIVAHPLVDTLLTAKWLPCVPYFQLLCVVGILYPLHVVNVNLLRAQGRMKTFMRLEIAKKALTLIAIVITYRWGITAMVWGQVVQSALAYFLNAHFGGRHIGYSWRAQFRDILPYIGATTLMGGAVLAAGLIVPQSSLARLLAQAAIGVCVYMAICHFCGLQDFKEMQAWAAQCVAGLKSRIRLATARG